MKNTLIFLCVDGLGLNSQWKGNCLKLADKPNINHLISGIYPWTTIMNDKKVSKINTKKTFNCVSRDIDKNFYQMLVGDKDVKTVNERITELAKSKDLNELPLFNDLENHSKNKKSKYVHIFYMLSNNKSHFTIENFKYILNILLKRGLKPLIHFIADGKEDEQFHFEQYLKEIDAFLKNRNIQIATISGRDYVFIKEGRDFLFSENIIEYYHTICGTGYNYFRVAKDYATDNLYLKVKDQHIKPAYNSNINKYFIEDNDAVLFLDTDSDVFSGLLELLKQNQKLKNLFISSSNPIYGNYLDSVMFDNIVNDENIITNIASQNKMNSLVLSLSHKKGFINKFYGIKTNDPNIVRKVIKTDYTQGNIDYLFSANKLIIDSAIKNIGKYDFIAIHIPTIAEAAREGDLKLLKFAIENFDKNLGRLINFAKTTGNVIAFASPFGVSEKMLNKKLEIITYNKNSIVPFVFTNGDLSTKRLQSDFFSLYSTLLVSLGIKDLRESIIHNSLITTSFNKDIIHNKLMDQYNIWREEIADPLVNDFEENNLSLYDDLNKSANYLYKKQQYIVLKEIINLHERVFTTPEARKLIFERLYRHIKYNGIDFLGFNFNYDKTLMTLFDDEIKLTRHSSFAYRFFDNYLWKTHIKKNDKWFQKTKVEIEPMIDRNVSKSEIKKIMKSIDPTVRPFQYFERLMHTEREVLKTNDAFKVVDFYDSVRVEVEMVYKQYFGKISTNKDDLDQVDETAELLNPDEEKIITYYETFLEVLAFVEENRDKAVFFNEKYEENIRFLKERPVITNVFRAKPHELNYMVKKIVSIYLHLNRIHSTINSGVIKGVVKKMNKYDLKYSRKHELELSNVVYENEFFEGVNLDAQDYYENFVNQKVKATGFFDYPTIDKEVVEDDPNAPLIINFEENDEVVDKVDNFISMKSEYDKTAIWNKKRLEEKMNIDNLNDISYDAESAVVDDRKLRQTKNKINNYVDLSKIWKQKQLEKDKKII